MFPVSGGENVCCFLFISTLGQDINYEGAETFLAEAMSCLVLMHMTQALSSALRYSYEHFSTDTET